MKPLNLTNEWPIEIAQATSHMLPALKSELLQHLTQLAQQGRQHTIDLTHLPLNPGDKQELESFLGKGEVSVTLSALGESHIFETSYSGIWWVKHHTADGQLLAEFIEITRLPEIIQSHSDDIEQSIKRLTPSESSTKIE